MGSRVEFVLCYPRPISNFEVHVYGFKVSHINFEVQFFAGVDYRLNCVIGLFFSVVSLNYRKKVYIITYCCHRASSVLRPCTRLAQRSMAPKKAI